MSAWYPFPWRLRPDAPWIIEADNGEEIAVFTAHDRQAAELHAILSLRIFNAYPNFLGAIGATSPAH